MAEYASRGVANTALGLGIAGTALSAITGAGGLAGILGVGPRNAPPPDPGDRPVTRYEMGLIQQINAKDNEIVSLKAAQYTDQRAEGLQAQISQQLAFNATAIETMKNQQEQIAELRGITRLVVPNRNVSPGWGPVDIWPATQVQTPAVSSGTASTSNG